MALPSSLGRAAYSLGISNGKGPTSRSSALPMSLRASRREARNPSRSWASAAVIRISSCPARSSNRAAAVSRLSGLKPSRIEAWRLVSRDWLRRTPLTKAGHRLARRSSLVPSSRCWSSCRSGASMGRALRSRAEGSVTALPWGRKAQAVGTASRKVSTRATAPAHQLWPFAMPF